MKTIHSAFLGIFLITINICTAQTNSWPNATGWTLYDLKGAKFYNLKVDTLSQLPHRNLDSGTMQSFLNGASVLSSKEVPAWMGAYVISYTYQHEMHKVDISNYSGFFYDESSHTFFQVAAEKQQPLHDYLGQNMNALLTSQ